MRCRLTVLLAGSLLLGCALDAMAEVRVKTDSRGEYWQTQIVIAGPRWSPRVWTVSGRSDTHVKQALNPGGDLNGDLWPFIGESPVAPHLPWVVWSRRNGTQYDLAWSRWTRRAGWSQIDWVEADATGDDLDAEVTFDVGGRPHVVWWRNEGGTGRVYLNIYLTCPAASTSCSSRWLGTYPVSDGALDSRFPTVEVQPDGSIRVEFETSEGLVSQLVTFSVPDTITDDINPLDHLRLEGQPVHVPDHNSP